jgi:hypothetical protein
MGSIGVGNATVLREWKARYRIERLYVSSYYRCATRKVPSWCITAPWCTLASYARSDGHSLRVVTSVTHV